MFPQAADDDAINQLRLGLSGGCNDVGGVRLFHRCRRHDAADEKSGSRTGDKGSYDQPRALNRFVDVENFRNERATMLTTSIHLSRGPPFGMPARNACGC